MSFKEQLEKDLIVFFDAEALADKLVVNDIEVTGILSENKFNASKNDQYGVFVEKKTLTLTKEDWEILQSPSYGYTLNINAENYIVKEVNYKSGVIRLNVEGMRT